MATVKSHQWKGNAVYCLENDSFTASVIPEIGGNVYRLYDKKASRDVLRAPEHPDRLREKTVHFGIPLLCPPCRTKNGAFTYNGRRYQLEINTPDGHHIHGFLRDRPWRVTHTQEGDHALITMEFRTSDFPELNQQYPHDLVLEARTELNGDTLQQTFTVRNLSQEPAPFGFGLHTWFMLDAAPEDWTLRLPAEDRWELDPELVPSGNLLPLDSYESLKTGMNLEGQDMDMVLRMGAHEKVAVLSRPGYTIRYSANDPFTQWVIYTKGIVSDTICLEPLTWTPNAPNVDADPSLTGLRAIEPGGELVMRVNLQVERA